MGHNLQASLGGQAVQALFGLQLAAVMAMAIIVPWAGMSTFLIIIAWQVAMATLKATALSAAAMPAAPVPRMMTSTCSMQS